MCEEENEENCSKSQKDIIKIIAVIKTSQVQQLPLPADLQTRHPPFFSAATGRQLNTTHNPPQKFSKDLAV